MKPSLRWKAEQLTDVGPRPPEENLVNATRSLQILYFSFFVSCELVQLSVTWAASIRWDLIQKPYDGGLQQDRIVVCVFLDGLVFFFVVVAAAARIQFQNPL